MGPEKGMIVIMGSGELTATMVEVHKELLGRFGPAAKAVFLDTPAGFQLNVDQISQKAQEYFQAHIQQPLAIASYKSNDAISPFEAEQAYQTLREADFVLIGPGSPTYAVQQWRQSAIPQILSGRIKDGGCLVAASAAALTVGRFTLPVYEIYKVGQDLHWVDGMDILKEFGFNLVVLSWYRIGTTPRAARMIPAVVLWVNRASGNWSPYCPKMLPFWVWMSTPPAY
jgi:hypothetical protein